MTDKRTYRPCVRVLICKDKKVLMGKKIINGAFVGYEFPGGGLDNNTAIQAVKNECLEEVGWQVTNIVTLNLDFKYEVTYKDPERQKLYKGGIDHFYTCDAIKKDSSLHGSQNDALPHDWYSIEDAIKVINEGPESLYNPTRIKALALTKKIKRW